MNTPARTHMLLATLTLILTSAAICAAADWPEKKLIAVGWDMPNAERLRANYELMDELPFRGTSLRFTGRGNAPFLDFAHGRDVWKPEDIAQIIEDLAAAHPQRVTHNFLDIKATPGDVDWFDEEGWAIIVDHWRTAARVAKQGGIAGILFDPESYRNAQFGYRDQPQAAEHSFDEYCAMARQRGREVMAAVTQAYPDITIFSLFMLSIFGPQVDQPSPALATSRYGLYPAFINGWLDAVGPEVTLVDGCESAYRFNSNVEYLAAANLIRNKCRRLIAPENRYRYRAQVQVSFGVYLDAYVNPPDSPWHIDPGDQTPLERLEANLTSALNAADEYVWLYGEQASWWPSPHPTADKVRWGDLLPGVEEMLWSVIEPTEYAARLIDRAGNAQNLLTNADFSTGRGGAPEGVMAADWETEGTPAGWGFWQSHAAGSEGNPGWDSEVGRTAPGAATMRAVRSGCLIQSVPVKPGGRYAVATWHRLQGEGTASVRVRWQTADGKWTAEHEDRFLSAYRFVDGWQQMVGVVRVPEGAGRLVVLLSMDGQQSEADVAWWDDVVVLEVPTGGGAG